MFRDPRDDEFITNKITQEIRNKLTVWIIFEEDNDVAVSGDGDEAYFEWQTVVKVVDSREKAIAFCEGKSFHSFKEYKVE